MKRRNFHKIAAGAGLALGTKPWLRLFDPSEDRIRVGVIGLDTSHAIAFTKIINGEGDHEPTPFQVTHAYPQGSKDIESSTSRIPGYVEEMKKMGINVVGSIDEVLDQTEVILLETNDGRRHLEQATQVLETGKICFIDKPIAASLADAIEIFTIAEKHQVPVFSASSLRFSPSTQEIAKGRKIGRILGADTYSPATIEKTHPDLFWYGVHGVESLFTLMGTGCQEVQRVHKPDVDVVTGVWSDGRIGSFRGLRSGKTGYGGLAFGADGISEAGKYEGYEPLVREILTFFETGNPPVGAQETIEIFAFMAAAEESKNRDGARVALKEVIAMAEK